MSDEEWQVAISAAPDDQHQDEDAQVWDTAVLIESGGPGAVRRALKAQPAR